MEFDSEDSRNAYFPHPKHEVVKNMVLAVVDEVIAFDFAR
jgi:hypothetical protein